MSKEARFLAVARRNLPGLFSQPAPAPVQDQPVQDQPDQQPAAPAAPVAPPVQTARPDQPAAPVVGGPSLLMRDAYEEIEAAADRIVGRITARVKLSSGAARLFRFLVVTAVGNARARGLTRLPDVAEFHMPGELLALFLDVDRVTVWRWTRELSERVNRDTGEVTGAQLVATHDHKTGHVPLSVATKRAAAESAQQAQEGAAKATKGKGRRRFEAGVSDGLLWAVSLTGPRPGLQVSGEALAHEWRNLAEDSAHANRNKGSAEGLNTVYALKNNGLQQSIEDLRAQKEEELSVRWTVTPGFRTPPPLSLTVAGAPQGPLGSVWDAGAVRALPPRERASVVDSVAQQLAAVMQDSGSVNLYRWILWRLCRLDTIGVDLWHSVLELLDKVRGDQLAGSCNKAGAVVMWRMKTEGLWTHLKEAPAHRVGYRAA